MRLLGNERFLVIAILVLVAGIGIVRSTQHASAWHPTYTELWAMHTQYSEEFCVQVLDGSMSDSTLYSRVRETLYVDNPSQDWDLLAWDGAQYKIVWVGKGSTPCDSQLDRVNIEVQFSASSGGCGGTPVDSCLDWWDGYAGTHGSHDDYYYAYVKFATFHINPNVPFEYHHVVNHETGHILGLQDPPPCGSTWVSVMHPDYYCTGSTKLEWPDPDDIWCVDQVAWWWHC